MDEVQELSLMSLSYSAAGRWIPDAAYGDVRGLVWAGHVTVRIVHLELGFQFSVSG